MKSFTDNYKGLKTCWVVWATGPVEVEIIDVTANGVHYRHIYNDDGDRTISHIRQIMTERCFKNPNQKLYLREKDAWDQWLLHCEHQLNHFKAQQDYWSNKLTLARMRCPFGAYPQEGIKNVHI